MIINEALKSISIEKNQNISFDDIVDAAYVDDVIVQWKKNDQEDHQLAKTRGEGVLFLSLNKPYFQPGKLSLIKSKEILIKVDRKASMSLLECLETIKKDNKDQDTKGKDAKAFCEEDFPMTRCIVEAKIRSNNYVRGGTTGSNPYGKAGLVSAVLLPSVDTGKGEFSFKYLGTNSSFHHSAFFKSQPIHFFNARNADSCQFFIAQKESKWLASAIYRSYAIEKNDDGRGIWYVKAEKLCDNLMEAALWLELAKKISQGSSSILEVADEKADKKELVDALELLKKNGLMSQSEYDEKLGLIRLM